MRYSKQFTRLRVALSSSSRLSHLTLHSKRATSHIASLQGPSHQSDDDQRQDLKKKLALVITKLNASVIPNPSDIDSIMSTINTLITLSPTKEAAFSPLLDGSWILLWTGSYKQGTNSTPASLSDAQGPGLASFPLIQEASDAAYSFFYKTFPLLAGSAVGVKGGSSSSLVKARGNYQIFDLDKQSVVNEARFEAFGTSCQIRVGGMIAPVQSNPNKISATFTNGRIDIGSVSMDVPIGIISPVGFVDTPYLDEDLRISIGDKGSVFIARKIKGPRDTDEDRKPSPRAIVESSNIKKRSSFGILDDEDEHETGKHQGLHGSIKKEQKPALSIKEQGPKKPASKPGSARIAPSYGLLDEVHEETKGGGLGSDLELDDPGPSRYLPSKNKVSSPPSPPSLLKGQSSANSRSSLLKPSSTHSPQSEGLDGARQDKLGGGGGGGEGLKASTSKPRTRMVSSPKSKGFGIQEEEEEEYGLGASAADGLDDGDLDSLSHGKIKASPFLTRGKTKPRMAPDPPLDLHHHGDLDLPSHPIRPSASAASSFLRDAATGGVAPTRSPAPSVPFQDIELDGKPLLLDPVTKDVFKAVSGQSSSLLFATQGLGGGGGGGMEKVGRWVKGKVVFFPPASEVDLHKSLADYLERKQLSLEDVFAALDGDLDGSLEGPEVKALLSQVVPAMQLTDAAYFIALMDFDMDGCIYLEDVHCSMEESFEVASELLLDPPSSSPLHSSLTRLTDELGNNGSSHAHAEAIFSSLDFMGHGWLEPAQWITF